VNLYHPFAVCATCNNCVEDCKSNSYDWCFHWSGDICPECGKPDKMVIKKEVLVSSFGGANATTNYAMKSREFTVCFYCGHPWGVASLATRPTH
jgi:hypothetical protein